MTDRLMPDKLFAATTLNTVLDALYLYRSMPSEETDWFQCDNDQILLGYVLPPFQRAIVWDEAQMTKFIESAWLGFHLGTWVCNDTMEVKSGIKNKTHKTDRWLIDGQQRITALDQYWRDEFPVFGYNWSELTSIDQRVFRMTAFACSVVRITDETDLRELYNRLNFGGTVHTDDQKA